MSTITRMWLGFAALCAGIIHLALVASSPLPIAIVLGALGGAECVWGVVTFVRVRILFPRVVLVASLTPILLWGSLVASAAVSKNPAVASYLGFDSMALASALGLFLAVVLAVSVRRGTDFTQPTRAVSAPRYLIGVLVGGMLAATIVTPALGATEAGKYAQPMESMQGMYSGASTTLVIAKQH